jgi:hypothetical protein
MCARLYSKNTRRHGDRAALSDETVQMPSIFVGRRLL